jgi:hypothetical protein
LEPQSITHQCDYLLRPNGMLEFYYSYLTYAWRVDDVTVLATHYFERPGLPTVTVEMPFEKFDQPKYASILTYLQQRYLVIQTADARAYAIHWISSAVRLNAGKQRRAGKGREVGRPPRRR